MSHLLLQIEMMSTINMTFYLVLFYAFYQVLFLIKRSVGEVERAFKPMVIAFIIIALWLALQAYLANNGWYSTFEGSPSGVWLSFLFVLAVFTFLLIRYKHWFYRMPGKWMTTFHVIRVPIALLLYGLYMQETMPKIATFSGMNYNIIIGLTAPVMAMWFYSYTMLQKIWILLWNIIGLIFQALATFYILFSIPSELQIVGLQKPNFAVLEYPLIWLPTFIIPLILLIHVVCIMQLMDKNHSHY